MAPIGTHDSVPDIVTDVKEDYTKEEQLENQVTAVPHGEGQLEATFKSKWEELDRVKTIKIFWKMSLVCFAVAFSAAADGYQVRSAPDGPLPPWSGRSPQS